MYLDDDFIADATESALIAGSGGGMMLPAAQPRGVTGVNSSLDSSAAPGLNNLETIIAATVRAVTGQLSGIDGSANGALLRRNANPSGVDMTGAACGAFGVKRWSGGNVVGADGVGGGWCGEAARRPMATGMPSADAVRSGMLASDNDPNTLYVGNVS